MITRYQRLADGDMKCRGDRYCSKTRLPISDAEIDNFDTTGEAGSFVHPGGSAAYFRPCAPIIVTPVTIKPLTKPLKIHAHKIQKG